MKTVRRFSRSKTRTYQERTSKTDNSHKTSWGSVGRWYSDLVGESGHFFHQKLILPKLLKILNLKEQSSLIDLACGEGVLERALPQEVEYLGVDIAESLLREAQKKSRSKAHKFISANLSRPFRSPKLFQYATCILALQNMKDGKQCIKNAANAMKSGGRFVLVLNHPAFRIPRQSSWETDQRNKLQFRRINRYFSPLEIPIQMNPGKDQGKTTWSYHHPISTYFSWLKEAGFVIEDCQEWVSEKESVGKVAKMENRARAEFPMFLCLIAKKI